MTGAEMLTGLAGTAVQPYGFSAVGAQPVVPRPDFLPPTYRLVTPGGRLGAVLLDLVLVVVTLWIGWLIWAMITWTNGQTPAKQLLGHVVADAKTGEAFTWGRMFLRDFVIRGLLFGLINTFSFGIFAIVDCCMVFGADHRTLHDQMAGSIVRFG